MSCVATRADVERFRSAIAQNIGLQFDDTRLGFLGEVLERRLQKLARSNDAYLRSLEHASSRGEMSALARELTVCETYFFRNQEQFHALAEVVFPARMRTPRTPPVLRVMSAGCASGEEAYSIAIAAREAIADPSWSVAVRAVDLNSDVLARAARGRYSAWSLRETPPYIRARWFCHSGRDMIVADSVRAGVTFESGNLASDDPQLWPPATYDAIFCRNVLMYFSPEQMRAAVARIARVLAPGGFLFLGHAETLRGVSDAFHLHHSHGTFYYERKAGGGKYKSGVPEIAAPSARAAPLAAAPSVPATPSGEVHQNVVWLDSIRASGARVAKLLDNPSRSEAAATVSNVGRDIAPVLDLLRRERFAEALALVQDTLGGAERDKDVLLLEATLLAHGGQFTAAEEACARLFRLDALNAGGHYVLALCRQQADDRDGAAEHDQLAAHLDPTFAMPRLHLGLMARQCGDFDTARRELAQAQLLLRREEASRLLMFGGGFSREALIRLCDFAPGADGNRP